MAADIADGRIERREREHEIDDREARKREEDIARREVRRVGGCRFLQADDNPWLTAGLREVPAERVRDERQRQRAG